MKLVDDRWKHNNFYYCFIDIGLTFIWRPVWKCFNNVNIGIYVKSKKPLWSAVMESFAKFYSTPQIRNPLPTPFSSSCTRNIAISNASMRKVISKLLPDFISHFQKSAPFFRYTYTRRSLRLPLPYTYFRWFININS